MLSAKDIYIFEQYLLDRISVLPKNFIPKDRERSEEMSIELIRFVVERYLGWTPEVAYNKLTPDIIRTMKLTLLCQNIYAPSKDYLDRDFYIIIQKLYPDIVTNSFVENVIAIYKKVLNGELPRFPKGFFEGAKGETKALFCLRYAMNQKLLLHSNDTLERYLFFSRKDGAQFIRNVRLGLPLKTIFENAIEYYHASASPEEKSDFAYMVALCRSK